MPEIQEWKHLGEPEPKGFQVGDIVKYISTRHRYHPHSNPEWGRGGIFIVGVVKDVATRDDGYHHVSWRGGGSNSYQDCDLEHATAEDIERAAMYERDNLSQSVGVSYYDGSSTSSWSAWI